jgi:hypothetical protein
MVKTKVALTYDEFKKTKDRYYEQLLCGHYIPEDKSVKYHLQEINCPICGKTRTMGKTMNVSSVTAKKLVSPEYKNTAEVMPVDERLNLKDGQRVIIYAPKQVYTNGGMAIRKANKKEKAYDGKKGTITKSVWGTFVGAGYEIKLDDGSVATLNYEWVNKLEASDEVPPCPDCGGKRDEDYLCPNCVINPPQEEADEEDIWCHCGEKETFGSYPQDGECSCGMHKHHVHCGTCGKISQVG